MFVPGQRWISSAEPELGLGTVLHVSGRGVQIFFPGAGEVRQYARHSAPLVRAVFRVGQTLHAAGGDLLVERVEESGGLLTYHGAGRSLAEGELADEQDVTSADQRLLAGDVDAASDFELRLETLTRRAEARRSPAWGLLAARVELLPHQLQVVARACRAAAPRVLLADEVGLGKTIEAGMILRRKLATGQARRVLVLVPDHLQHQWFVELLRRFNLGFALFDDARLDAAPEGTNAFEAVQWALVGRDWLLGSGRAREAVLAAPWDLLVVDEAHHLEWTPAAPSPAWTLVAALARQVPGVVLLTATPEQAGARGHFARLRLLDPARYADLAAWEAAAAHWAALSPLAARLAAGDAPTAADAALLRRLYARDAQLLALLDAPPDAAGPAQLLEALIDRHGPGRVMFRNRRDLVGGFPPRHLHVAALPAAVVAPRAAQLAAEFAGDVGAAPAPETPDFTGDPRVAWLQELLAAHAQDKFLLICRSRAKVEALARLLAPTGIAFARFHEGLGLMQRDRNAAWFAAPDGARLLLASEIGSEGRNFQFARHLLLWDLPLDPDLLEQRIGRLDRLGRGGAPIDIHVPRLPGTAQDVLLRWQDEGLGVFARTPADARALLREFGARVVALAQAAAAGSASAAEVDALITASRREHERLEAAAGAGRDRLLELATRAGSDAARLGAALEAADADAAGHAWIERLLEHFGVQLEDLDPGIVRLDPEYLSTDALPGFEGGPRSATFRRDIALRREDLALLRLDHPLVQGATDLLLGSMRGNAGVLLEPRLGGRQLLLQAVFVLECVAPAALDVQRFLPAQPIVVTVDSRREERPDWTPSALALELAARQRLDARPWRKLLQRVVPPLQEAAAGLAEGHASARIAVARAAMEAQLGAELERLEALRAVNPAVDEASVHALLEEREALRAALPRARLRLDALRVVMSPALLG